MTDTGVALAGLTKRFGYQLALGGIGLQVPADLRPLGRPALPPDGLTEGRP